jgi:sensor histidine kinase YesM
MHPLLSRNRFGFYLLAWVPLAGILVFVISSGGNLSLLESTLVVVPLCLLYAFICLSAWYTCKSAPIQSGKTLRLFVGHTVASVLVSLLWMALARAWTQILSQTETFRGLDVRFAPQTRVFLGAGLLLYLLAVASHYVILSLESSRQAESNALEARILARDAELKALKAQINPHFLFNSLNSINALTSANPAKAREMCILLAEFLRLTLGLGEKNSITFAEELSLVERFLAIEKVRFGNRLRLDEDIQKESKAVQILPLLLQPLVENAVMHGIANLPEGGTVRLASYCDNGRLSITIENTFDAESTPNRRGGMGLANVRRRLEGRYGSEASLNVSADAGSFRVQLSLPVETGALAK